MAKEAFLEISLHIVLIFLRTVQSIMCFEVNYDKFIILPRIKFSEKNDNVNRNTVLFHV